MVPAADVFKIGTESFNKHTVRSRSEYTINQTCPNSQLSNKPMRDGQVCYYRRILPAAVQRQAAATVWLK